MAKYCFPAIIEPDEPGFMVTFPDIENCFTSGENLVDALEMGEDVLNLMLTHMEDQKEPIPAPSDLNAIHPTEKGAIVTLILADTVTYRKKISNMAVKKTLSIPQWLNTAAEAANVNFSQTLQEALTAKLGMQ
ncbi:MAG: type II toxin-antitoxin system HicB family antitoxin [Clostridia bacterium]|nr:type II toxin-antitoxin system HicB family antitoxin [Clostridia bacterium]MBR4537245.1 type II toxin-antitoxin system HicB family antitoxin [Clostridia bacterium]MBR4540524.1 type II toxin-antitoxin system HicB family antitoxin [Clostridia bacterium]